MKNHLWGKVLQDSLQANLNQEGILGREEMNEDEKLTNFISEISCLDTDFIEEPGAGEDANVYTERKYIILIIYDIISNKQRVKMAKLLSGYGVRVQKSAFEARLSKKQYARLLRDIKKMLQEDDNVRIYKLHGYEEIMTFGSKQYEMIEDVIII